ncbi:MAG: MFS transporter [Pseudomonadota bacterium]
MEINVNKVIDDAKINPFIMRVAIICCLCAIIEGYEMIVLGMIIPNMARDWGLKPQDFQLAQLAVLVGILLGSILAGVMSDKIGRKNTILIMFGMGVVGIGLSIFIQEMWQLVALRLFTGIGAGGSLPIALALVSEYGPRRYRNLLIVFVFAGAPLATTVGGFGGPFFLSNYGWQGMFIFGLAMALPLWIIMFFLLPDSIKYLVSQGGSSERKARELLTKVSPELEMANTDLLVIHEEKLEKSPIRELFMHGRAITTLLLWLAFVGGQFIVYFVSLWLPTVLQASGWEQDTSLRAIGQYYLGGSIGALLVGYFQDRFGVARVLTIAFPVGAVLYFVLGQVVDNPELWFTIAPFAGAIAVGAILGKAPLAASLYPTTMRGTGVGTAMGIGRVGSLITPPIGAALIAGGITASQFFYVTAIAPLLSALAIFIILVITRRQRREER